MTGQVVNLINSRVSSERFNASWRSWSIRFSEPRWMGLACCVVPALFIYASFPSTLALRVSEFPFKNSIFKNKHRPRYAGIIQIHPCPLRTRFWDSINFFIAIAKQALTTCILFFSPRFCFSAIVWFYYLIRFFLGRGITTSNLGAPRRIDFFLQRAGYSLRAGIGTQKRNEI